MVEFPKLELDLNRLNEIKPLMPMLCVGNQREDRDYIIQCLHNATHGKTHHIDIVSIPSPHSIQLKLYQMAMLEEFHKSTLIYIGDDFFNSKAKEVVEFMKSWEDKQNKSAMNELYFEKMRQQRERDFFYPDRKGKKKKKRW